jgi:hypothetical protein
MDKQNLPYDPSVQEYREFADKVQKAIIKQSKK